jgi:uncharacterized protein (DUF1501 family)
MAQHLDRVQAVLGSVAAEVTATAKEACQLDLDQLAAQLMQQEAQSMGFLSKRGWVLQTGRWDTHAHEHCSSYKSLPQQQQMQAGLCAVATSRGRHVHA